MDKIESDQGRRRRLTDGAVAHLGAVEVEDVLQLADVLFVDGLDVQTELLHERTRVDGPRVRVRVPGLLLHRQRRFRHQTLQPTCKFGRTR